MLKPGNEVCKTQQFLSLSLSFCVCVYVWVMKVQNRGHTEDGDSVIGPWWKGDDNPSLLQQWRNMCIWSIDSDQAVGGGAEEDLDENNGRC